MERGRTVLPKKTAASRGRRCGNNSNRVFVFFELQNSSGRRLPRARTGGERRISSAGFSSNGKLAARRIAGGSRRLRAAQAASSGKKNVPFRDFLISFQPVPPSDCLPIFRSFLPFSAMPERPGSLPRYRPRLRRSPPCTRDPRCPGGDPKNPAACKFCVPDPLR